MAELKNIIPKSLQFVGFFIYVKKYLKNIKKVLTLYDKSIIMQNVNRKEVLKYE